MSIFGVGPLFVVLAIVYSTAGLATRMAFPELLSIPYLPRSVQVGAGVVLLAIGLPFFVAALRTLRRGFPEDRVFTDGVYAACRHPVYAAWVVFIVPGLCLLSGSLPGILVIAAMYVTLRLLVRKEERFLEDRYGDEYRAYKRRTPPVLPLLWRAFSGSGG